MLNKKIIKFLSLVLCGILLIGTFAGCSKKEATAEADPNATISTPQETEKQEEEKKEELREIHDMAYYLKLQNTDTSLNFKYQGTFMLDNELKDKTLSFRQLLEKNEDLSVEKDKVVDPMSAVSIRYKRLPRTTSLTFKNKTESPVAMTTTKIGSVTYKTTSTTYLYSLIGEQAKVINKDISFLDSAIDVLGTPIEAKDIGDNTLQLAYAYDEYVITITCNLTTQEGTFEIAFI